NIKLLNGGLAAWKATDEGLSELSYSLETSDYKFQSRPDSSFLAMFSVVQSIDTSAIVLLDTRGEQEHSGEFHKNGAAYPGHIDGAVNLDWAMAVDYGGTQKFLSVDTLKERYAAIGIDGTKPVVTYCHSGVRSAHTLFVLTELLGYRNIKNYDGSWIQWSHLNEQR
ncbi:rhodanese-like domain-containing protein, partial [Flavobacteriales bacterium]|nr:rhodanese-like domain-containing protein [Flavobacteriales bacterium]